MPLRSQTTARYICTVTQLIAFTLRAHRGLLADFEFRLAPELSSCSDDLLQAVRGQGNTGDAIHRLILALLSQVQVLGSAQCSSPTYYFIIFLNVTLSGTIKDPEYIRASTSGLEWALRATAFWEMVRLLKGAGSDIDG